MPPTSIAKLRTCICTDPFSRRATRKKEGATVHGQPAWLRSRLTKGVHDLATVHKSEPRRGDCPLSPLTAELLEPSNLSTLHGRCQIDLQNASLKPKQASQPCTARQAVLEKSAKQGKGLVVLQIC